MGDGMDCSQGIWTWMGLNEHGGSWVQVGVRHFFKRHMSNLIHENNICIHTMHDP